MYKVICQNFWTKIIKNNFDTCLKNILWYMWPILTPNYYQGLSKVHAFIHSQLFYLSVSEPVYWTKIVLSCFPYTIQSTQLDGQTEWFLYTFQTFSQSISLSILSWREIFQLILQFDLVSLTGDMCIYSCGRPCDMKADNKFIAFMK